MAKKLMNNFKETFVTGLGLGGGLFLGFTIINIVFAIIGLIFFIGGLALVIPERKKSTDKQNKAKLYGGFVLIALGGIFGFSLGFQFLSGFVSDEFELDI